MNEARSAILVLGRDDPSETTLRTVEEFDEVFVVERAVPDPADRYIIDEERAYRDATQRLTAVLTRLRTDDVHATGIVGDPDPTSALADARAFFPGTHEVVAERAPEPHRLLGIF